MAVEVGEQAPDFELTDQHGTPVRLSGFRGAKNVVLIFYPLAFSGVCSGEMCAIRDEFPEVNRDDVELLTVSVDSMITHRPGRTPSTSTSDCCLTSGRMGGGHAVRCVRLRARRRDPGTFIIDKDGVVRWKVVNPIPQARDLAIIQTRSPGSASAASES